jgi:hypothetical protein
MNSPRLPQRHSDTSNWMTLRWVRGTRYYRVHLEQDLWNEWLVTQVYGRIGSRLGHAHALPAASIEGEGRGYRIMGANESRLKSCRSKTFTRCSLAWAPLASS